MEICRGTLQPKKPQEVPWKCAVLPCSQAPVGASEVLPERPREAQRASEKHRDAQRGPERPREAQRGLCTKRGPERPSVDRTSLKSPRRYHGNMPWYLAA